MKCNHLFIMRMLALCLTIPGALQLRADCNVCEIAPSHRSLRTVRGIKVPMKGSSTLRSNLRGREFLVPLIVTRFGLGILFGDFAFRDTLFSSPLSLCASPKSLEYSFTALLFSLLCFVLFLTVNGAVNSKGCGPSLVCVRVCVCVGVQLPLQVRYVGMCVQMQK